MSADSLIKTIDSLKFKYLLVAGVDATMLLLPKRKSFVKTFCEDLAYITGGEAGNAPLIFDRIWRQRAECSFRDLEVRLYDGDELAVGCGMEGDVPRGGGMIVH